MARCLLLCFLFALLPLASRGEARRASSRARPAAQDAPSGFLPGNINYFAGDGPSQGGSFTNGAIPTQVPLPNLTAVGSDGAGNIYIATSTVLYMVYAGGPVPVWLANVTTNATPSLSPQAGRIYEIGGLGSPCAATDPSCGEGGPLYQASFANIIDLAFDRQGNMYIETPPRMRFARSLSKAPQ